MQTQSNLLVPIILPYYLKNAQPNRKHSADRPRIHYSLTLPLTAPYHSNTSTGSPRSLSMTAIHIQIDQDIPKLARLQTIFLLPSHNQCTRSCFCCWSPRPAPPPTSAAPWRPHPTSSACPSSTSVQKPAPNWPPGRSPTTSTSRPSSKTCRCSTRPPSTP